MKHNRVTIGDIIATHKGAGRINKVTYEGPHKQLHVGCPGGHVFLTTERDIVRISKKRI